MQYEIASVPKAGKYTLCSKDGQVVRNGEEIDEKDLEFA